MVTYDLVSAWVSLSFKAITWALNYVQIPSINIYHSYWQATRISRLSNLTSASSSMICSSPSSLDLQVEEKHSGKEAWMCHNLSPSFPSLLKASYYYFVCSYFLLFLISLHSEALLVSYRCISEPWFTSRPFKISSLYDLNKKKKKSFQSEADRVVSFFSVYKWYLLDKIPVFQVNLWTRLRCGSVTSL